MSSAEVGRARIGPGHHSDVITRRTSLHVEVNDLRRSSNGGQGRSADVEECGDLGVEDADPGGSALERKSAGRN
jgi:hypothetical protein